MTSRVDRYHRSRLVNGQFLITLAPTPVRQIERILATATDLSVSPLRADAHRVSRPFATAGRARHGSRSGRRYRLLRRVRRPRRQGGASTALSTVAAPDVEGNPRHVLRVFSVSHLFPTRARPPSRPTRSRAAPKRAPHRNARPADRRRSLTRASTRASRRGGFPTPRLPFTFRGICTRCLRTPRRTSAAT